MSSQYVPLYNRYSPCPAGWQEEDSELYYEFTLTALQSSPKQPLRVPPDGDFYWRGLIVMTLDNQNGASTGDATVLFTDAFGNTLQNVASFLENIGANLGGALTAPIFPELFIPANGYLLVDLVETLGSTTQVEILLTGVTRWQ